MSRPATRLSRLVELARLREGQARQTVAVARTAERTARAQVDASQDALRHLGAGGTGSFRFGTALRRFGRDALVQAEDDAQQAAVTVESQLDAWRARHQQLGTLERLDERLHEAILLQRRQREQRETDELAMTRPRVEP